MTPDELFMLRCLELATRGRGFVSPNPLVGCVVVHNGRIIGEGWHQKYGEAHAEVNALATLADTSKLAESTLYVNLEPCAHFGKTPPCTNKIVEMKIRRVVVANIDTHPLVAGKGIQILRDAGIEVVTGVLEKEGRELNKRFFTFAEQQRPYIILKWAQTADHFLARENYESRWISNEYSRQRVHQWRSYEDAVLVGTKTAAHDNPKLTVRLWAGRNPVRVVLDRFLRLTPLLHLFDGEAPTLHYNVLKHEERPHHAKVRVDEEHFVSHVVHDLHQRHVQSVLVEGGAQTLQLFLDAGLWDEARVFQSPRSFGKGIAAPVVRGRVAAEEMIFDDRLTTYVNTGFPARKA